MTSKLESSHQEMVDLLDSLKAKHSIGPDYISQIGLIRQDGRVVGQVVEDGGAYPFPRYAISVVELSEWTRIVLNDSHPDITFISPDSDFSAHSSGVDGEKSEDDEEGSAIAVYRDGRCPRTRMLAVDRGGVVHFEPFGCERKDCEVCGPLVTARFATHMLSRLPQTGWAREITEAEWPTLSRWLRDHQVSYCTIPLPDARRAVLSSVEMPRSVAVDSKSWLVRTLEQQDVAPRRRYSSSFDWGGWTRADDETAADDSESAPAIVLHPASTESVLDRAKQSGDQRMRHEILGSFEVVLSSAAYTREWHHELARHGLMHRDTHLFMGVSDLQLAASS